MMKQIRLSLVNNLALFSLIFGFAILTGHARATPPSEPNLEEIKKIESRLLGEREKLRKLDFREKDLLAEVAGLEQEVTEKRGAVNDLSQKIRHASAEIDALKRNLLNLKQLST